MKKPHVALQDIVCWKILREITFPDKSLIQTVYWDFPVSFDKVIEPTGSQEIRESYTFVNGERVKCFTVRGGFLHTIFNRIDAVIEADEMKYMSFKCTSNSKIIVAECIIPKGTEYYEGMWAGIPSYASRKLFIKGFSEKSKTQIIKK